MSQKDHVNRIASKGNKHGTLYKSGAKKKSNPGSDIEEIATVWNENTE